jgi:hypothetical protein
MKTIHVRILALIPALLLAQSAHAQVLRISQISGFATGQLGATGVADGWAGAGTEVTNTSGSGSLDGTGLGLVASAGDKVEISAVPGHTTYNVFASSRQILQVNTNIYYSFLYRFNNAADVDAAGETNIQIKLANSGSTGVFDIESKNVSGQIQMGVNKPTGTPAFATTNIAQGQTIFVVVRHQLITGANNDQIDLWINPPTGSFNATEANVPPPSVSTISGTESTSATGPGRFYLDSGANTTFDELRIAYTWAEVTPPAGSCTAAGITTSPAASVTNASELSTTFTVVATGTSPTYQWQVKTNGGSVFVNANSGIGTNSSIYTTPILRVADSGIQYRCIVSVACAGGSSATSAVSTITVPAPVVASPGIIVDDYWADLSRSNAPIATNSAMWRASTAGTLSDGSSGNMVATPASGSSSLWSAYFTDDTITSIPVHVPVGSTIKVTLAFTTATFTAFTNNSSLRIGLFDYADGGTRITNDTTAGGSSGNGVGVRGYMWSQDFGTNFSANSPMSLLTRTVLTDGNLMGTTGDYAALGGGPGGLLNAPAFQPNTSYKFELSVNRASATTNVLTAKITGGTLDLSFTTNDTTYLYPRFDTVAIRPNSLENSPDSFTFTQFRRFSLGPTPRSHSKLRPF